jgi:hypothetical protein
MKSVPQPRQFIGAGILAGHRKAAGAWRVLLFRRAIPPDRGAWSVVGGRQDPGESLGQTAIREAAKEAFSASRQPVLPMVFRGVPPGGRSLGREVDRRPTGVGASVSGRRPAIMLWSVRYSPCGGPVTKKCCLA